MVKAGIDTTLSAADKEERICFEWMNPWSAAEGQDEEKTSKEKEALAHENGEREVAKRESSEEPEERETWSSGLDFLMSSLSFCVGMGNMWRFPYLCYKNGGGAFLIPYVIMCVVAGFPLMFLEFLFGQYGRLGVVSIWKVCPAFQGIGWAMFFVSLITMIYYNMLNGWCFFYIVNSFAKDVPWRACGNDWNTDDCRDISIMATTNNCTNAGGTYYNSSCALPEMMSNASYQAIVALAEEEAKTLHIRSPSDEYFHFRMLGITDHITNFSHFNWQLALCLLFVWALVCLVLIKGIKASGKITWVTALFPYVVLIILLIRGVTLDGSKEGILYFLTPRFDRLGNFQVWVDAAVQVFFSLSTCWGGLITLASYNNFKNNCFRDAIVVTTGDCLTSIFGGIVVFAFIGYMAKTLHVEIEDVATQGAGLAFIIYPQAVTTMPLSPLWAILFMMMLINVGLGTQFGLVQTVHATLIDVYDEVFNTKRRRALLLVAICFGSYILGLVICTGSGIYTLQLMDNYSATYGLLFIGIFLCIAITWAYGMKNFGEDCKKMIGFRPFIPIAICWRFILPILLTVLLIFTLIDFKRTSYMDHTVPTWAETIGWLLTLTEFACIPVVAVYQFMKAKSNTIRGKFVEIITPAKDWGRTANGDPLTDKYTHIPLNDRFADA